MRFTDEQEIRLAEIAEKIFWDATNAAGGLFVEDASDLAIINDRVYEQGRNLIRYLKDIRLEPEVEEVPPVKPVVKTVKKGNK